MSGTRAYARATGRGTTSGPTRYARPLGPVSVTYRGTVELPPAAIHDGGPHICRGNGNFTAKLQR